MSPQNSALVEKVAEQMELPLEIIKAIIEFQGEDAAAAAHLYREVEFSGFGKFTISQKRVKNKLANMEKKLEEGRVAEKTLVSYIKHIEELRKKLYV